VARREPATGTDAVTQVPLPGGARVRFTGRAEGDLSVAGGVAPEVLAERRRAVVDLPWTWLRQVHGGDVVVVDRPGAHAGAEADAAVTAVAGAALAVHTADCAPVALASPEGVLGAAHAGWRGLAAGVLEHTVAAMRDLGATDIVAVLGPCIRPGCYEFGAADLDAVVERLGPVVRGVTSTGRPALDVPAAVRAALAGAGVGDVRDTGVCTACSGDHHSHRARGDAGRQAMVVWR
jgi:polyphenol oxidase